MLLFRKHFSIQDAPNLGFSLPVCSNDMLNVWVRAFLCRSTEFREGINIGKGIITDMLDVIYRASSRKAM
jgi:hypothetical protein